MIYINYIKFSVHINTERTLGRFNGGIPELAALGDYGDALQTVSEQIISKTKINPNIAVQLIKLSQI